MFSMVMEAKSLITFPSGDMKLPGAGFYEVTGLAWTGRGAIQRVEVSTDGGRTWALAALQEPVLAQAHTRFRFPWMWDGKDAVLQSRAVDTTGYVQPTKQFLVEKEGVGPTYHYNGIQSWKVAADGSVTNVYA
jgi:sulfane dehydrogenase subunit SoxC